MKASWTKEQIERYNKKVAEMKAEIDAENPNNLAERIQTARQGNKETLNSIKENADNVEKVLEMKKDMNKTNAYIKTLEMARVEELKGNLGQSRYYVYPNTKTYPFGYSKGTWYFVVGSFSFAGIVALVTEGISWTAWHILGWLLGAVVCFGGFSIVYLLAYWFSQNPGRRKKHYERCKRFAEVVKANNNRIPAYYGTKKNYYDALVFIQQFEKQNPHLVEPLRDYLSPEDRAYYERNSL